MITNELQTPSQAPPRSIREWRRRHKRGAMAELYRSLRKARVPVSDSHFRNIMLERFKPSYELAIHLSAATGVPVENLLRIPRSLKRKLSGVTS